MSAPTIQFEISDEAQALMRRIEDRPGMLRAIARTMDVQNHLTIEHISSVRMRGNNHKPFPVSEHKLGIRSALLSKSIRATKSTVQGDTVTSSIGSNIKYAGAHEYGFSGSVMVGGHIRKRFQKRQFVGKQSQKTQRVSTITRRVRVGDSSVVPHQRNMNIPARAPFRHGIMDRQKEIGAAVSWTILAFWQKSQGGGK